MMIPYLILTCLALAASIAYHIHDRRRRKHIQYLTSRIRKSALYADLYPALIQMKASAFSDVRIDDEKVVFRIRSPRMQEYTFAYQEHGFDYLDADRTVALAQAIAADLPQLADRKKYRLDRRNDNNRPYYVYTLRVPRT